jgi:CheY-like chemotaxis protein
MPSPLRGRTLLVVDDDAVTRDVLRILLEHYGCTVVERCDGEAALERVRRGGVQLVVAEVVLPRMGGRELLVRLAREHPEIPVALVSGEMSREQAMLGLDVRLAAFLTKPFTAMNLIDTLVQALTPPVGPTKILNLEV